jgi:hypothetical protein
MVKGPAGNAGEPNAHRRRIAAGPWNLRALVAMTAGVPGAMTERKTAPNAAAPRCLAASHFFIAFSLRVA